MHREGLVIPHVPFDAFERAKFAIQRRWDIYWAFLLHVFNPRTTHRSWPIFWLVWLGKAKILTVKVHIQLSLSIGRRSLYCFTHHGIVLDGQVTHVVKILDDPFHLSLFFFRLFLLFLNKAMLLRLARNGAVLLNEIHDGVGWCVLLNYFLLLFIFIFFIRALF